MCRDKLINCYYTVLSEKVLSISHCVIIKYIDENIITGDGLMVWVKNVISERLEELIIKAF